MCLFIVLYDFIYSHVYCPSERSWEWGTLPVTWRERQELWWVQFLVLLGFRSFVRLSARKMSHSRLAMFSESSLPLLSGSNDYRSFTLPFSSLVSLFWWIQFCFASTFTFLDALCSCSFWIQLRLAGGSPLAMTLIREMIRWANVKPRQLNQHSQGKEFKSHTILLSTYFFSKMDEDMVFLPEFSRSWPFPFLTQLNVRTPLQGRMAKKQGDLGQIRQDS